MTMRPGYGRNKAAHTRHLRACGAEFWAAGSLSAATDSAEAEEAEAATSAAMAVAAAVAAVAVAVAVPAALAAVSGGMRQQ